MRPNMYDLSRVVNSKKMRVKPPLKTWYTVIATWFYTGLFGFAPGTLGSFATYPIYYFILCVTKPRSIELAYLYFWIAFFLVLMAGYYAVERYQKATNAVDHSSIVVDEVAGVLLVFACSLKWSFSVGLFFITTFQLDMKTYNAAFIVAVLIFRIYDITKPFFIRYVDRYMKNTCGVMLDDLLAALFTAFTLYIIHSIRVSYNL